MSEPAARRRVVITGIGALSPNGLGREAFWSATRAGRSGIRRITAFDPAELPVQIAGELPGFDPAPWIKAKDTEHVPRVVTLAVAAAGEALADAALPVESMDLAARREIGIILGTGGGALAFTELQYQRYFNAQVRKASVYSIPSSTPGTLSSEVSMWYGLKGMSHVISTGCTSSTDALGYAALSIAAGRLPIYVAGGVDAPLAPGIMAGFCMMRVLTPAWNAAPERASRPFSADRSGFVLAEGAWLFVLEEREHARARGARIYAEVAGYGSTCDAYHRVRLDESGEEPARAMGLACADAGLGIGDIQYINCHGTSTELNDRIETRAIKRFLGARAAEVPASSTKSLVGHPQGASGALGVAATVLGMRDGVLPPTINLDRADPECDLDYVPNTARAKSIDVALCNCIGFGSKNSALVIRRSPE
ncbi:MAG: beta-ketoacyl-[acyl-carrier-protein] synthase family protein [Planctomycetes bacterium]|nr:beta-ketoacyl-[acyl-carrier-protein] synthase family protein [Planctomycetota bacterium]